MATKVSFNLSLEIEDISNKIKSKREQLNWSAAQLARQAGISQKTIYNLENPNFENSFSEEVILKVERALNICLLPNDKALCANLVPLPDSFANSKFLEIKRGEIP